MTWGETEEQKTSSNKQMTFISSKAVFSRYHHRCQSYRWNAGVIIAVIGAPEDRFKLLLYLLMIIFLTITKRLSLHGNLRRIGVELYENGKSITALVREKANDLLRALCRPTTQRPNTCTHHRNQSKRKNAQFVLLLRFAASERNCCSPFLIEATHILSNSS